MMFKAPPRTIRFWLPAAIFLAILVVGLGALSQVFTIGHEVLGTGSAAPLGLWLSMYIYFIGLSAGAVIISGATYVLKIERFKPISGLALVQGIVFLATAIFFIIFDVGHPARAYQFFATPNPTSALAWIVILYTGYFIICLVYLFFGVLGKRPLLTSILAVIAILAATTVGVAGGVALAVVKARPYWASSLLPILFLNSALLSGTAALIATLIIATKLAKVKIEPDLIPSLAKVLLVFVLFEGFFEFTGLMMHAYWAEPMLVKSLTALLIGHLAPHYWSFIVLAVVIPALILLTPKLNKTLPAIFTASLLAVVGVAFVRYTVTVAGLYPPLLPGLPYGVYAPTAIELIVAVGWLGLALFLILLGTNILPVLPKVKEK